MAFYSPQRKVSDAENKLRVLCCLRELGMATVDQLWPFVAQMELMEYVPFCLFVDELRSDGAIAEGDHALSGVLYLTAEGEKVLELFGSRLVHADRERIAAAAPAYAAHMKDRRQARAAYERVQDGLYSVVCTVQEDETPMLLMRLRTPDAALAERMANGFRAAAPQLLMLLYGLEPLQGAQDVPEAATQQQALATPPMIYAYGGHAFAASAQVCNTAACCTLSLLLPARHTAQGWAAQATAQGERLADRVLALFDAREATP